MQKKWIQTGALVLALTLLTVPAGAAQAQTDWDQPYAVESGAFLPAGAEYVEGIYVVSVPASADGSFVWGGRTLQAGDVLAAEALSQITLQPKARQDAELTMEYCPITDNRLGQPAQLTVAVSDGKTEPPEAQDAELETYKNIANNGVLTYTGGAEGEVTYTVTREPKRGTVTVEPDGTYLYTPNKNKVGRDSFHYTVTDAAGNTSQEAAVEIEIRKPVDAAAYADLEGDASQFEAMWLRSSGLFAGKELAGQRCFEPQATINRGEFLVMVMQLAGIEPEADAVSTGFADGDSAPAWLQPYLAQAVRCGIVRGMESEQGLVFCAEQPITCAQASVLVQNVLQLPQPQTTEVFAPDTAVPVWAQSAVQALDHAGLGLSDGDFDRALTRREAANMLYAMEEYF